MKRAMSNVAPRPDLPSLMARLYYLSALQGHWPEFWHSLHAALVRMLEVAIFEQAPPKSSGEVLALLEPFFAAHNVSERWLKAACFETIEAWLAAPDSPAALRAPDPGLFWFSYMGDFLIPVFAPRDLGFTPVFSNPYLLKHHPGEESAAEDPIGTFRRRCVAEFQAQFRPLAASLPHRRIHTIKNSFRLQLTNYVDAMRRLMLPNRDSWTQAQWLALSEKGLSDQDIAVKWEEEFGVIVEEATVRMGRIRFASIMNMNERGPASGVTD